MSFGWSFGVFWMVNFRFSIGGLAGVLGSFLDAAMYWFIVVCIDLVLVLGVLVVAGVLVILWFLVGELWFWLLYSVSHIQDDSTRIIQPNSVEASKVGQSEKMGIQPNLVGDHQAGPHKPPDISYTNSDKQSTFIQPYS